MIEHPVVAVSVQQAATTSSLAGFSLAMRYLSRQLGDGVLHARSCPAGPTRISVHVASAIQPLRLQLAPRHVVLLRADQAEHVALAAVLADQRRGQAEPPAGLDLGRHAEHRGRQQVDLVVDDQAPVALVEELEVRELLRLVRCGR